MRQAFKESLNTQVQNHNIANTAFGNAISLAWSLEEYDALREEWKIFKQLKITTHMNLPNSTSTITRF